MQFKVGDKVRFLNEVGGGIISRIINAKMVNVRDEDGFEIPVMSSEIVVVATTEATVNKPDRQPVNTAANLPAEKQMFIKEEIAVNEEGSEFETLLAFFPVDAKDLSGSDLELFLINDSPYNMLYTVGLWTEKNKVKLLSKNDLEPDSKEFIHYFYRTDLNKVQTITVTYILYKQTRDYESQVPEQVNIELNPLKFVKHGSFEENDFFDEKSVMYIVASSRQKENNFIINAEKLADAMKLKKNSKTLPPTENQKKTLIEEIDLHIENLVDSPEGLDNSQILDIQKSRFITALDLGIAAGTRRMVFIHGVGNGKLKYEIRRLLDSQYAGKVRYQDASFKEYGYGATMVILK